MHLIPPAPGGQSPSLLQAALEYCRRGWSIIPIASGTKQPPKGFQWKPYQTQCATESQIRGWFADGRTGGLAVVVGKLSDLVCRDFDTMDSYNRWAADYPALAKILPTVATARGRHVYFRCREHSYVDLGDGELRGDSKHYCLLPPSRHPAGPCYRWLIQLPEGTLPMIDDVRDAGFLGGGNATERTEYNRENGDHRGLLKRTEAIDGGRWDRPPDCSVLSVAEAPTLDQEIERVIHEALPTAIGRRNRQVFELARGLKSIPELADAPPEKLEGIVRRWHRLGVERGVIGTKPSEETFIDFLLAWPKVKFPKGVDPVMRIFEQSLRRDLPQAALQFEQVELRRLVALCRELQQASGDVPFFLDCRTAGRLLKVHYSTAWRWLFFLAQKGVICEVEKGDRAKRRASRYRYVAD